MYRNRLRPTMGFIAGALLSLPSHASLIGDSVTASLWANSQAVGTQVSSQFAPSAVVGDGTEFTGQWRLDDSGEQSQLWDIAVDIGATSFTVSAHEITSGANNIYYVGNFLSVRLGDLDLGSPITDVRLVSGVEQFPSGAYAFTKTFTTDSVSIDLWALPFGSGNTAPHGGSWTFSFLAEDEQVSVAEPGAGVLFGLGLAAIFGLSRRRNRI